MSESAPASDGQILLEDPMTALRAIYSEVKVARREAERANRRFDVMLSDGGPVSVALYRVNEVHHAITRGIHKQVSLAAAAWTFLFAAVFTITGVYTANYLGRSASSTYAGQKLIAPLVLPAQAP